MKRWMICAALLSGTASVATATELATDMKKGDVKLTSAGPIAFAPQGVLLAADPKSAMLYAIETGDTTASKKNAELSIDNLDEKIASLLGTVAKEIQIVDMATNPLSGSVYLSVTRGNNADAMPALLRVKSDGKIEEVATKNVPSSSAKIPNPANDVAGPRGNPRTESITDLAYTNGKVYIAGLSNEEFASNLRSVAFPFSNVDEGASIEIYHGAHGAVETRSPVRTFAAYEIGGKEYLLAAYTCTPLVLIPVNELETGKKVRGKTIAELGNRNRPLDMVIYRKGDKDYVLLANSARGLMKITTEKMDQADAITQKISDKAGMQYETLELKGVDQLDRLNETSAVAIVKNAEGVVSLKSFPLP